MSPLVGTLLPKCCAALCLELAKSEFHLAGIGEGKPPKANVGACGIVKIAKPDLDRLCGFVNERQDPGDDVTRELVGDLAEHRSLTRLSFLRAMTRNPS